MLRCIATTSLHLCTINDLEVVLTSMAASLQRMTTVLPCINHARMQSHMHPYRTRSIAVIMRFTLSVLSVSSSTRRTASSPKLSDISNAVCYDGMPKRIVLVRDYPLLIHDHQALNLRESGVC